MKAVRRYEADDGEVFDTIDDCRDYEARTSLVGLTVEQIENALSGASPALGAALERLGRQCTANRIARGEGRRRGAGEQPVAQTGSQPAEPDEPIDLVERGRRDFQAGVPAIYPTDLMDKDDRERWLDGWDAASKASAQAKDQRRTAA